jgi:hypothetical protein
MGSRLEYLDCRPGFTDVALAMNHGEGNGSDSIGIWPTK